MSKSRESAVYEGELFFGEPKLKTWDPVCAGVVTVSISAGTVCAFRGEEKVWEYKIEPSLKCRVKDTFVQWQAKGPDGPVSHGMRLKSAEVAQKFLDALTTALADVQSKPVPEPQVVLKVMLPGKETTTISAPKSMTMAQLLKLIAQRRHVDPLQYCLALPPDSPHSSGVPCQPQSTVGSLRCPEVHLVKRSSQVVDESPGSIIAGGRGAGSQPTGGTSLRGGGDSHGAKKASQSATDGDGGSGEQTIMLNVELPKGDKMAVRVNANELLPEVLKCLCEMRDMNPEDYTFDPPSANIASKTLLQLGTNKVKIVPRPADKESRKGSFDRPSGSPVLGRKSGPPPPPPAGNSRKLPPPQPPAEQQDQAGRRGRSGSLDSPLLSRKAVAAPPVPAGASRKVQPELVRELTLKLKRGNTVDVDEEDSGQPPEVPYMVDDVEEEEAQVPRPAPLAAKGISASVSVDGLSEQTSKRIKQACGADVNTSEAFRTLEQKEQPDGDDMANSSRRQVEGQGRYHSIKKKPVKIPEDIKSQVKHPDTGQVGGPSQQGASLERGGDTLKEEAGRVGEPTRLPNKAAAVASVKQPERQESFKQPVKQESSKQPERQESFKQPVKQESSKQPERQESFKQPVKQESSKQQGTRAADMAHKQQPTGGKQVDQLDVTEDKISSTGSTYSSLRRKNHAAAPPPPTSSDKSASLQQNNNAVTLDQKKAPLSASLVEQSNTAPDLVKPAVVGPQPPPAAAAAGDKTTRTVPARPAPARPAPARPAPPPPQQQNTSSKPLAVAATPPTAPAPVATPGAKVPGRHDNLSTTGSLEGPSNVSPRSQRRGGTLVSTYDRGDGGKVLVVRQSPVLGRRNSIPEEVVFNFPPPPSTFRDKDGSLAPGGKGAPLASPTKSDTSVDEVVLSPTKTDTSVEITNLDDVMSSSADEGDGRNVLEEGSSQGKVQTAKYAGEGTLGAPPMETADQPRDGVPRAPPQAGVDDGGGACVDEDEDSAPPLPLPPPPSDFEFMPPEPMCDLGSGNEDDAFDGEGGEGSGEIILLSVKLQDDLLDIPPHDGPVEGLPHQKMDDLVEIPLLPPVHEFGISPHPSPPLTPPVISAPPLSFGMAPPNTGPSSLAVPPPPLSGMAPPNTGLSAIAPNSSGTTASSVSHSLPRPLSIPPAPSSPVSVVKGSASLSTTAPVSVIKGSASLSTTAPVSVVKGSASLSTTAPVSVVKDSASLPTTAPVSVTTSLSRPPQSSGYSIPHPPAVVKGPPPLSTTSLPSSTTTTTTLPRPPQYGGYPIPARHQPPTVVKDPSSAPLGKAPPIPSLPQPSKPPPPPAFEYPPPPAVPPPPTSYPTPPPLRPFDVSTLLGDSHFDFIPPPVDSPLDSPTLIPPHVDSPWDSPALVPPHVDSPLDSPALVPPPVDSPLDSPGLYQTNSLSLLEPPSIPEHWHSEPPLPDHLPPVQHPPATPPPPDSSPPHSPVSIGSSPVPHAPPPPPITNGYKSFAPPIKPKPPATTRHKHVGAPFSEAEDPPAHGVTGRPPFNKHPLSIKTKAPSLTRWMSVDEEDVQSELLSKLQERKARLKEGAPPLSSGPQPVTAPPGGDSMQVQLQLLQQQMLQQQMMHLQQQFQQLQMANMGYSGVVPGMAGMNLGLYHQQAMGGGANPAMLSMPMGGPFPPTGYVPQGGAVSSLGAVPHGVPPPFGVVGLGSVPGYPIMSTAVAQPSPLPTTSSAGGEGGGGGGPLPRRMSRDEIARSEKLGNMEDKFDSLMSEVRDADPLQVLKKVPEEKKEKDSGSPYTGMAAALADALKQRRIHLTEKGTEKGTTDAHEWESSP